MGDILTETTSTPGPWTGILQDRLREVQDETCRVFCMVMLGAPYRTVDDAERAMRAELKPLVLLLRSLKDDLDERAARRRAA
jgi:hypothetical protein